MFPESGMLTPSDKKPQQPCCRMCAGQTVRLVHTELLRGAPRMHKSHNHTVLHTLQLVNTSPGGPSPVVQTCTCRHGRPCSHTLLAARPSGTTRYNRQQTAPHPGGSRHARGHHEGGQVTRVAPRLPPSHLLPAHPPSHLTAPIQPAPAHAGLQRNLGVATRLTSSRRTNTSSKVTWRE